VAGERGLAVFRRVVPRTEDRVVRTLAVVRWASEGLRPRSSVRASRGLGLRVRLAVGVGLGGLRRLAFGVG
jgi:hypothetical protein